jgi:hypothetical protein
MTKKNWFFTSTVVCTFLVIILAYLNHFDNAFHFDDWHCIQENPYITSLKSIPQFFIDAKTFSVAPKNQSYRPLLTTSYAFDYWTGGGLNPLSFHITSFLLFILQCVFLYFIFLKLLDRDRYFALFASALYGVHTAMAETVNYISARSDILSTLLIVLALYLYIYSERARKYYLYLIPAAFSVLAKETAVIFPVLLWAYIALFEKKTKKLPVWKKLWPSVLTALVMGMLSFLMLSKSYEPSLNSRWEYVIIQPYAVLHYFLSFVFPFNLNADTDWVVAKSLLDERVIIGFSFVAGLLVSIWFALRNKKTKPLAFGLLWFVIACIPTSSGIVPLAELVNDHRMFFPFIGLVIVASWSIKILFHKFRSKKVRWLIIACMLAILVANAVGVHNRNKVWHSEETLWLDVTVKSPKNGRGLMNYGLTQMGKGNYLKAEYYYTAAMNYTPNYPLLYVNMGILKNAQGNVNAAELNFLKAMQLGKNWHEPYYYYSDFLRSVRRYKDQETALKLSLSLAPSFMKARHAMLQLYAEQRRWKELGSFAKDTLTFSPSDTLSKDLLSYMQQLRSVAQQLNVTLRYVKNKEASLSLIALYYQLGDYDKCIVLAQDVLKQFPDANDAKKYLEQCKHYL